jgi:hypothetical protein
LEPNTALSNVARHFAFTLERDLNMFDPTAGGYSLKTVLFNIALLLELVLLLVILSMCFTRKSGARKHKTILICILVLFNVSVFVGAILKSLILMAVIFLILFLAVYAISWMVISLKT